MGCKKYDATKRVIVIQKEKRPGFLKPIFWTFFKKVADPRKISGRPDKIE